MGLTLCASSPSRDRSALGRDAASERGDLAGAQCGRERAAAGTARGEQVVGVLAPAGREAGVAGGGGVSRLLQRVVDPAGDVVALRLAEVALLAAGGPGDVLGRDDRAGWGRGRGRAAGGLPGGRVAAGLDPGERAGEADRTARGPHGHDAARALRPGDVIRRLVVPRVGGAVVAVRLGVVALGDLVVDEVGHLLADVVELLVARRAGLDGPRRGGRRALRDGPGCRADADRGDRRGDDDAELAGLHLLSPSDLMNA